LRQDVQQEAPQELQGSELLLIAVRRVAPAKSDLAILSIRIKTTALGEDHPKSRLTETGNKDLGSRGPQAHLE
jgi:hypothetical protein